MSQVAAGTLRLSCLLQTRKQNQHAAVIAVYLNAIGGMIKRSIEEDQIPNPKLLIKYLGWKQVLPPRRLGGAERHRIWDAKNVVVDVDKFFNRYMSVMDFDGISADSGLVMKEANTIVEKWPTQLKLKPEDPGAVQEFDLYLASGFSSFERYTE